MRRTSQLHNYEITKLPNPQSGYILITLMLALTLAALALLAVLPDRMQQIKRDQEEEMCHRGTEYMRAIQHFYKKFGRYPTRIEDLENTNNMRFLRKRYTDPLTRDKQGKEKDFKLLHMQDVNVAGSGFGGLAGLAGAGNLAGAGILGAGNMGAGNLAGANALANNGLAGVGNNILAAAQSGGAMNGQSNVQQKDQDESDNSQNPQSANSPDGSSSDSSSPTGANQGFNTGGTTGTGANNTVFGGGPILGVASTSKEKTIREYNKKNHYNDWMFIYDPTSDRGGLLVGPWQTPNTSTLQGATPMNQMPGAQQQPGSGSPFGSGQSFGGQSFGGSQPQQPQQQQPQPSPQNQDTPNQQ
jgi:type II secretory pathway pseudopilin PulG